MIYGEGTFIKIERERCLNIQHHSAGCRHCVTHCPGGALSLGGEDILFDSDSCLGCGLCFSLCPTAVFTSRQWDEATIVEEVKRQSSKTTQFFCEYHETPYLEKEEGEKGAIQVYGCLCSISKGAWYETGLHTAVELRLDKCSECPMKKSIERLQHSIDVALEWLTASGHSHDFSYIYKAENIRKKKKYRAVSSGIKVTSRRDLFLGLFSQSKEVVSRVRQTNYRIRNNGNKKTESLLPGWQRRFAQTFTENFQEGGSPAYWPSIEKSTSCVNCGLCINNCPTKTLQITIENGRAFHTFTSGECLDCRLCELFCPTESIARDRRLSSNPFQTERIYETSVTECRQCGSKGVINKQHLCYWCQNEASDSELISDAFKYLLNF